MSLPPRQEFDLEGAATYLGCSTEEFSLHLHLGDVRLAITTDGLDYDFAAPLKDLPLRVQKEITGVLANGKFVDILKPPTLDSSPATSFQPNYLYLSREARQLLVGSSNGKVIQEFQTLDGQQVTIWLNGELGSAVLKRLFLVANDGWISDTVITKEELDRFSGADWKSPSIELKTQMSDGSSPVLDGAKPFQVPELRVDEIAEAMVEYGNLFFLQRKRIPTHLDLQAFMLEEGGKALQMTYDPKGKDFIFSSKPLSKRAFRDRYKEYRVKEDT